ncbi:MAG TPA: LLM class flavin-dependent oxidoreductase, partial [Dehalococcoidia bacterium]|nr:LLM class flavin-dependent oxidoreductase [Dehalococcoidia bacterium]
MEFGVGLDGTLQLSYAEQAELSAEAARLGYTQVWTPEGNGEDSFQLCAMRWAATRDVIAGGVTTGIGVSPVPLRTPMGFAMSAGTLSKMTEGRFILGVGSGQADVPNYRRTWNMRGTSTIGLMRDYVTTIRSLVRGESVDYEGPSITYHGAKLSIDPPPQTPIYLAALGPNMTMLAGEVADGVSLNWCDPETIALARARVKEGAERAGRDPSGVKLAMYIRVCVDEDETAARRAYARAMQFYALG